jgi:hypothetical protein
MLQGTIKAELKAETSEITSKSTKWIGIYRFSFYIFSSLPNALGGPRDLFRL